ncbi:MAG: tRNA dihydrouridine(20/20a) synthase DusA [Gammaproteobacteria bacterium]|nr:tRNA dihydrouridine(20/20a) synthase DusA [Gammaproteobacteria bacterium]
MADLDPWRISVAPMMDCTDRHCRYFLRLLSPHVRLYSEMVTAAAIVRGDPERLLRFSPAEHPLALQLGGSDPELLAMAVRKAAACGYDEINLNVGCPSSRVSEGSFGACLMAEPALVGRCVSAMQAATHLPVTVKTRIGIDDRDDYGFLQAFVASVAAVGCRTFVIHARKALLSGLSPKENREIPPLLYATVYRLKADFPELRILLNGGVEALTAIEGHLAAGVDGVMIGRKAYADPYWLTEVEAAFLDPGGMWQRPSRSGVVRAMARYAEREMREGLRLHHITRHMLGLYHGQPGARAWRRHLSTRACAADAGPGLLLESLQMVPDE